MDNYKGSLEFISQISQPVSSVFPLKKTSQISQISAKRTLASIVLASSPAASGCVISLPVEILHALGGKYACKFDSEACMRA